MSKGVVLSKGAATKAIELFKRMNNGLSIGEQYGAGVFPPTDMKTVRVTSATKDADGNYPAVVTMYDTVTPTWVDFGVCVLRAANNEKLKNATRYDAYLSGENSAGDLLFMTHFGGVSVPDEKPFEMLDDQFPLSGTTCDVYRGGGFPPATPAVSAVACLLGPMGMDTLTLPYFTHVMLVGPTVDVRDDFSGGSLAYGPNADRIYVPDKTGTEFRVLMVRRIALSIGDKKHVLLARSAAPFPTQNL